MTGRSGWRARISLARSMPPMPGTTTSEKTTSIRSASSSRWTRTVAKLLEGLGRERADVGIVLDDEHDGAMPLDQRIGHPGERVVGDRTVRAR